jgi:predicted RNA-binding Zn-ribbon protein involved in translation (DUF1610 family)
MAIKYRESVDEGDTFDCPACGEKIETEDWFERSDDTYDECECGWQYDCTREIPVSWNIRSGKEKQ